MIQAIRIHFSKDDIRRWDFSFSSQGTMRLQQVYEREKIPEWIQLENFQCPACTLDPSQSPACPVARVMAKYAFDLADRRSFEIVDVEIFQLEEEPFTIYEVPLQRVVGELVRLGAFQYECPIGRKLKQPMTELRPFPENDEILEAFSKAFADQTHEGKLESEGVQLLEDLHDLFGNLSLRLDQIGRGDAHLNGVVILHSMSVLFSLSAPRLVSKFKEKQKKQIDEPKKP